MSKKNLTAPFMGGRLHILDFVSSYKRGEDQNPEVMAFLHDAFCQILCNVPAEKALDLQGRAGNTQTNIVDKLNIYTKVMALAAEDKTLTLTQIFESISKTKAPNGCYLSTRQIQKYYEQYSVQFGGIRTMRNPTK